MPLFCLALGVIMGGAFTLGGEALMGASSFALFVVFAAVAYFARGNETIQGLSGPGRDERWAAIDLTATAYAGLTVIVAIIGAWLYEIARGHDGNPYGILGAIAGVAYVVSVVVLRARG
jgi:hypothetical protein